MDTQQRRSLEVGRTVAKIRQTEDAKSITRDGLDEIKDLLIELAKKDGLCK